MTLSLLGLGAIMSASATLFALYAFSVEQLRETIKRTSVRKWFNRCGGTAITGAGIVTAGIKRSV